MLGMERKANAALLSLALLDLVKIRSRASTAAPTPCGFTAMKRGRGASPTSA
jgi:hypothetical protein